MAQWWVTDILNNPNLGAVYLGSWVFWVIASITLHELSHGWMAIRCGDDTPIVTGHMTWNPLVHMGVQSLIVFALFGVAWGLMPVSPSRFRRRYDDARVAFAGPSMNLTLAVACLILYIIWVRFAHGQAATNVFHNVETFLRLGGALNIALFLLNLLPIPPLDGSRILSDFSPAYARLITQEAAVVVGLILFCVVFKTLSGPLWDIAFGAFDHAASALLPGRP